MIANLFYELPYPVKAFWQHLTINSTVRTQNLLKKAKDAARKRRYFILSQKAIS